MHPGSLIEATQILMQLIRGGQSVMVIVSSTVKYIYLSYTVLDKAGEAKVIEDMLFMIQK